MRVLKAIIPIAAIMVAAATPAYAATNFSFQFDGVGLFDDNFMILGDGPITPPVVGSGSFISATDLTPGTYDLSSLTGFTFTFTVNGDTYTNADIVTPLDGVAIRITDAGGGIERLFFTESGGADSDGGANGGSLDLSDGTNFLSFEPSSLGGNFLYQETGSAGRYLAVSVAEPSTWAMMILGFGFVGFGLRRGSRRPITI
jgi:hypothetical protein